MPVEITLVANEVKKLSSSLSERDMRSANENIKKPVGVAPYERYSYFEAASFLTRIH